MIIMDNMLIFRNKSHLPKADISLSAMLKISRAIRRISLVQSTNITAMQSTATGGGSHNDRRR